MGFYCHSWTCNVCNRSWISVVSPIHRCPCGNTAERQRKIRDRLAEKLAKRKRKGGSSSSTTLDSVFVGAAGQTRVMGCR